MVAFPIIQSCGLFEDKMNQEAESPRPDLHKGKRNPDAE